MAAGILFFAFERRSFITKSGQRMGAVERRLTTLENQVSSGNEKIVQLLGAQLDALNEIKRGQSENFSRMWQMTLSRLEAKSKRLEAKEHQTGPQHARQV
jgi:TolA-binding protein